LCPKIIFSLSKFRDTIPLTPILFPGGRQEGEEENKKAQNKKNIVWTIKVSSNCLKISIHATFYQKSYVGNKPIGVFPALYIFNYWF